MKLIIQILILFLAPMAACGQTVHIDEDRIVYKGTVVVNNASQADLYQRARDAMQNVSVGKAEIIDENKDKGKITAKGKLRLVTPYHLIRTVEYVIELTVEEGQYTYRIDSVYLKQAERGAKTTRLPSEKLVKGVEATGAESVESEKELNEIDMNFQKLLAIVHSDIKRTGRQPKPAD